MSFADIAPDISLERYNYHLLPQEQLDRLEDAEALYERGRRFRYGAGIPVNEELGWELTLKAAMLGHPLARAYCYDYGIGVEKDLPRAVSLYRACAERGHPAGTLPYLHIAQSLRIC
jgi:TPR repeat protein